MSLPNKAPWSDWSFPLRVGANRVPGVSGENTYGFNSQIGASTEDIWNEGGVLDFLTSAETLDIASSSAEDNPSGTGAASVTLYGVNEDYLPIKETIALNGLAAVETNSAFLRVNRMRIGAVGSNGTNVGTIEAQASFSATIQASIGADLGSSTKSQYTVPAGYYGYILSWSVGTLNNDQAQADLQTRNEGLGWVLRHRILFVETAFTQTFVAPLDIPPKSDIRVQATRVAGSGNIQVSTNYDFYLVKEELITPTNTFS